MAHTIESMLDNARERLRTAVTNGQHAEAAYWRGCIHGLYQVVQEAGAMHGKREAR